MSKYSELRRKFNKFVYHGFEIEENNVEVRVKYAFETVGLSFFEPLWIFPKTSRESFANDECFKNLVFSLGLVELVSYWKLTCSPEVFIKPCSLSLEQVKWWKKLYFGGLGEFFYTNSISADFDDFMTIKSEGEPFCFEESTRMLSGNLVAVGGGKDSAVSLEIVKSLKDTTNPFVINGRGATVETSRVAGYSDGEVHTVKRTLDRRMIELNREGYLNGHTPFSAIVAFSSVIDAYITHKKYVVLSNESSANESTVLGSDVNHQFSKGFEFEKAFREYEKTYLKTGVSYFSLLRPLSEFQIAMLFSRYKKYHSVFKSCNVGSKTDVWCGDCPKCLFVYIILSPFLSEEELVSIFGNNLFEKESLIEIFKKLTGLLPDKPFECVGSRDEIVCALALTIQKYENEKRALPYLLAFAKSSLNLSVDTNKYFEFYDSENFIPEEFEKLLKEELLKG